LFLNVTTADGTPAMTDFTQSILEGSATAKGALTTLPSALQSASKS
jgi:multiple sugar transport system substrate-binding protein